jgi:hypothetical protein
VNTDHFVTFSKSEYDPDFTEIHSQSDVESLFLFAELPNSKKIDVILRGLDEAYRHDYESNRILEEARDLNIID